MNYATWQLNFTDPNYGTGPEEKIAKLGSRAEGGWADGEVQDGATIMGYVDQPQDESKLTAWNFKNITQQEALALCLGLNSEAYLAENGHIAAPLPEYS
jgi:hypothetical protein